MCNFVVFDAKDPMRRKFVVRMRCAFTPSVRSITRCSNFKVCARCEREGGGERGKEREKGEGEREERERQRVSEMHSDALVIRFFWGIKT